MLLTPLFTLLFSISVHALPLDGNANDRKLAPRSKTYAIVNVDGGSPTAATTTIVDNHTRTVQVTDTATDTVTATAAPAPPQTSSSRSSSSASTSAPTTTPTTISEPTPGTSLVTVIVTEAPAPTEYYDNGLWHTRYPVKTKWD